MYYRLGSDFDLFLKGDDVNLYGSFVYGKDVDRDFVGGLGGYEHLLRPKIFAQVRWDGVFFIGDAPMPADDDGDGHGGHKISSAEDNLGDMPSILSKTVQVLDEHDGMGGGHAHGAMIMDDASSISAGIFYMPYANLRVGLEYVYQLKGDIGKGIEDKGGVGMLQIQFGF